MHGCIPGGYTFGSSSGSLPVLVGVGSEVLVGGTVEEGSAVEVEGRSDVDRGVDVECTNELDGTDEVGRKDAVREAVELGNSNEDDERTGVVDRYDDDVGWAVEFEKEVVVGHADEVVPFPLPGSCGPIRWYGKAKSLQGGSGCGGPRAMISSRTVEFCTNSSDPVTPSHKAPANPSQSMYEAPIA